ncbi:MAG: LPS-assembly protein LptD [Alphaproteobacteria bacterium]|nr:LPS-assembly protein LptD [Alphaproteobacteria bacterium]
MAWAAFADDSQKAPVDFSADRLIHDEDAQIISARGNVELVQSGRILRADEIIYSLREDRVIARGNVVLNETNGDVHFAEEVEFTNEMRDGFVIGLRSLLADGSRFAAGRGERTGGQTTIMYQASYTPCEPCKVNPDKSPVWQITADKVTHHAAENRVSYNDAKFEVFGVPVAWTPYFSHPDGSVKQKTGFLTPSFGYDSELGAIIESRFYWGISPNRDATIGTILMTQENPVLLGEYRHRWADAMIELEGSGTYSGRTDSIAGEDVVLGNEERGHFAGEGLWNVNERWRTGFDVEVASDDQYLRQYDFSSEDVLESQLFAERFSGRDYAEIRAIAFQDVRVREERAADQPNILPEAYASFYGEPDALFGGRWNLELSGLGLQREGRGQDVYRTVAIADWQRRVVFPVGLLSTLNLTGRGDVYQVEDRPAGAASEGASTETRTFVRAHLVTSYPLAREFDEAQVLIEPRVAVTASPNIEEDSDIPNEDSQDVQIDASNLFEANRFPGYDRIEDQSRVTYGLKTGVYGHGGSHGDIFLGQSYRFDEDENPFPRGSGLSERGSDIVGQVSAAYKGRAALNYRFQIGSESLTSQRHEVDAYSNWRRLGVQGRYLFASALGGTDIDQSREQAGGALSYHVTDDWRARTSALYDLGQDPGLRRAEFGIDYFGQCVNLSGTLTRELTRDSSGDSGTEIMFRVGLKNLGEFETSGVRLDSGDSED